MDNLQSTTYEVFERDPVKYAKYEQVRTIYTCWSSALHLQQAI